MVESVYNVPPTVLIVIVSLTVKSLHHLTLCMVVFPPSHALMVTMVASSPENVSYVMLLVPLVWEEVYHNV